MTREDITDSQDYKATEVALKWWYSLPKEQRKATDIDAEPDIVDAYADGVIYGWNNPQWIPVEEELPKVDGRYIIADKYGGIEQMNFDAESKYWWLRGTGKMSDFVTHWMPLPKAPRKEE